MNNAENTSPSAFKHGDFSIDEARPMKVVVIGAGYSGIVAGIRFRQKIENLDLTIYESHAGVGGTWFVNKYPGLACDIPSHCYQLTFEDKTDWSAFYAPGPEIHDYLEGVVDKYKLRPYIKLQHRVTRAEYHEPSGKWHLTIKRPRNTTLNGVSKGNNTAQQNEEYWEEIEDTADVVFGALGGLSRWAWPDIEGLESFKGQVIHSAQWETGEGADKGWQDTIKSWGDKRVGVIGVGSSAIQLVPSIRPYVKHLVNYVRGKTWVSVTLVRESLMNLSGGEDVDNYFFTEKDKEAFKNREYYRKFRHSLEVNLNSAHVATMKGSAVQIVAQQEFRRIMLEKLAKKPWIADHIIPDFAVCCRRLTPGPGYLEALCEDNVDFIPTPIKKVTSDGIETSDGKSQQLDVIICATGFDTSYKLDFPVIGRGGLDLNDHHTPHPRTYLSVAVDGFPNWFQSLGPNSAVGAGSLLLLIERQVDYAVAATQKMQRERLKSMEVKPEAVEDFDEYLESYFPTTVFSGKCRSWYKAGKEEGRVIALWPGSSLHAARALAHPRWEDYNYEPLNGVKNRLHWLGDGHTVADRDAKRDRAWYLHEVDYPPVPDS
ncbi:FAD/NAD-P-binding domain-containing protein [Crucibulum laeve]|uniref:FAD/NAD-P-binding domain-containing protein n=1 Tax=Crucibulum laeve TaxID=68775 RepID=A0A5C3M9R8_9AGAR|nr:FAD/NAD-P-binding domain-containing protein [Crucibulum laeve]